MINYLILSVAISSLFLLMILLDSKIIGGIILLMILVKTVSFPLNTVVECLLPFGFMFGLWIVNKIRGKYFYFHNSKNAIRLSVNGFGLEIVKKLSLPSHLSFRIDDEGDATIHYWLGVDIYFTFKSWNLTKFISKQKYSKSSYMTCNERELRVAIHNGSIWFNFWDNDNSKRSWNYNLLSFLGKTFTEKKIQKLEVSTVCFSEGEYMLLEKSWRFFQGYSNLKWYYKLFGKNWLKIPEVSCVKLKEELSLHEVQNVLDDWTINYNNDWLSKNLNEELECLFEDRYVPNGGTKYGVDGSTHSIWFGAVSQDKYFDGTMEFYMSIMKDRIKNQGYCWTPKSEDNG